MKQPVDNNNNEYLERLTRRGPKRLHVLYKSIVSKFSAYNMNGWQKVETMTALVMNNVKQNRGWKWDLLGAG